MHTRSEPAATGLRMLFDLAEAEGGQLIDGTLQLPASVGTGFIQLLEPEPDLKLAILRCTLARELALKRPADATQPETLLLTFNSFGPTPSAAGPHLSSVQITSADIEFTTTLPAQTPLYTVGIAVRKALLISWLNPADGPPPTLLTTRHSVVLDALLTPGIEWVLDQLAGPGPAPYLAAFFYKIKIQELLYLVFLELARRAAAPARPLHTADVEKIFQVRADVLTNLHTPPTLAGLAKTAGLSETRLKQLFRQVFGSSIYTYYQLARMEEAKRLLQHLSVSETGYQLGFTNLSHFARLFEKHHGLTPKKYQSAQQR